jgi:hypothetical protein
VHLKVVRVYRIALPLGTVPGTCLNLDGDQPGAGVLHFRLGSGFGVRKTFAKRSVVACFQGIIFDAKMGFLIWTRGSRSWWLRAKMCNRFRFSEIADGSGTDVMFLKYFRRKNCEKNGVFDSKQSQIMQSLTITLVFEKNANFFAKNWQKLQKIVILTSTPGMEDFREKSMYIRGVNVIILLIFLPKKIGKTIDNFTETAAKNAQNW